MRILSAVHRDKRGLTSKSIRVETDQRPRTGGQPRREREALLDRIRGSSRGDTLVLSGNVPADTAGINLRTDFSRAARVVDPRCRGRRGRTVCGIRCAFIRFLIKPILRELHQLVANPQAPVSDQIQELRQQGA